MHFGKTSCQNAVLNIPEHQICRDTVTVRGTTDILRELLCFLEADNLKVTNI